MNARKNYEKSLVLNPNNYNAKKIRTVAKIIHMHSCLFNNHQRAEAEGMILKLDKDKGFHYLFQCVEKRLGPVAIILDFPMFKVDAHDQRYRLLKEVLGLAEYM